MKNLVLSATALTVLLCIRPSVSVAQHYTLDTTFAHTGIDTVAGYIPTQLIHRPTIVVPQVDDRKILIAGRLWSSTSQNYIDLMRLNYDGTLDVSFHDSGKLVIATPDLIEPPAAAFLYDTSKIIVLSSQIDAITGFEWVVAYNLKSDGSFNTAFGGGMVRVALCASPVYCFPKTGGIQTDGKLVILGMTPYRTPLGHSIYVLTRLLPNGTVDTSYGLSGRMLCPYPVLRNDSTGTVGSPRCGTLLPDNKFVVVGMFGDSISTYPNYQCFAVRHNMDGSPDTTFGEGSGITIIKKSDEGYEPLAMAVDAAGNFYIAAHLYSTTNDSSYGVIKLDSNGHRVVSYGSNGVAYFHLPAANNLSTAFAVQPDGRVIMGNGVRTNTPVFTDKFIAFRLDTSGRLDTSFNTGGMVIAQRDSNRHDLCTGAAVQPDGKILLVGYDSLSATAVCMRLTNYHNVPLKVPNAYPLFTSSVFPNPPYNGRLHIRYSNSCQASEGFLKLYDANGRVVDLTIVSISAGEGDIAHSVPTGIPAGIYYLEITTLTGSRQVHPVTIMK